MLKRIPIIVVLLLSLTTLQAQDVIFKKDGTKVEAKVSDITTTVIRYKRFTNQNGPTYEIAKSDVIKIVYPDGSIDDFSKEAEHSAQKNAETIHQMVTTNLDAMMKKSGNSSMVYNSRTLTTEFNELRIQEGARVGNVLGLGKSHSAVYLLLTLTFVDGDKKIKVKFMMTENDIKPKVFKCVKMNELNNIDGQFTVDIEFLDNKVNNGIVGNHLYINTVKTGKLNLESIDTNNRTVTGSYQIIGSAIDGSKINLEGTFSSISY